MRKIATKLTHTQFFKACEALKKNRQWFLDSRPVCEDAAKKLGEFAGLTIAPSTMVEIREACGIEWTVSYRRSANGDKFNSYTAVRTLTNAVKTLYAKLGEEIPSGVQSLVNHFANAGKPVETNGQTVNQ